MWIRYSTWLTDYNTMSGGVEALSQRADLILYLKRTFSKLPMAPPLFFLSAVWPHPVALTDALSSRSMYSNRLTQSVKPKQGCYCNWRIYHQDCSTALASVVLFFIPDGDLQNQGNILLTYPRTIESCNKVYFCWQDILNYYSVYKEVRLKVGW